MHLWEWHSLLSPTSQLYNGDNSDVSEVKGIIPPAVFCISLKSLQVLWGAKQEFMERNKILLVQWQLLVLVGVSLRYRLAIPSGTYRFLPRHTGLRMPDQTGPSRGRRYRQRPAVPGFRAALSPGSRCWPSGLSPRPPVHCGLTHGH